MRKLIKQKYFPYEYGVKSNLILFAAAIALCSAQENEN